MNEITDVEGEKIDERLDESTISSVRGATEGPVTVLSCQASLDCKLRPADLPDICICILI